MDLQNDSSFDRAIDRINSRTLGRRSSLDVYNEFLEYVDGSLVLAPIIYIHLPERANTETYNSFLIRLFNEDRIKSSSVKSEYDKAMRQLKENSI